MKPLPLVAPFDLPYEYWSDKILSPEEAVTRASETGILSLTAKDQLITTVRSPIDAAIHIANVWEDNALARYIDQTLDESSEYKIWRRAMPSRTPKELSDYQKKYPNCDLKAVDAIINEYGRLLSDGQVLFHGGAWHAHEGFMTVRPLSTTFCPQVAFRNAEHRGKAYSEGKIELFVLKFCKCKSKAFAFKRHGTDLGHENEVLLSSNLRLNLRSRKKIRDDYPLGMMDQPTIKCPIYVLEIDVS